VIGWWWCSHTLQHLPIPFSQGCVNSSTQLGIGFFGGAATPQQEGRSCGWCGAHTLQHGGIATLSIYWGVSTHSRGVNSTLSFLINRGLRPLQSQRLLPNAAECYRMLPNAAECCRNSPKQRVNKRSVVGFSGALTEARGGIGVVK